jgi:signal transduction histidine kinase
METEITSRALPDRGTVGLEEEGELAPREATEGDGAGTRLPRGDIPGWTAIHLADVPELDPEAFDVHALIAETAARFAGPAAKKGIALEVKASDSVPRFALGEVDWLREVLCGLIDNAIRFTDAGEVVASITADPTGGGRVLFHAEISDSGRGMSPETLTEIFGPRNGRRFTPLTGISGTRSLGVAHRLVELMDGRLDCSSMLGKGTTACLTVPLDLPDSP